MYFHLKNIRQFLKFLYFQICKKQNGKMKIFTTVLIWLVVCVQKKSLFFSQLKNNRCEQFLQMTKIITSKTVFFVRKCTKGQFKSILVLTFECIGFVFAQSFIGRVPGVHGHSHCHHHLSIDSHTSDPV